MMHENSFEPAAIRFTLERLQEYTRQSGYFSLLFYVFTSTGTLESDLLSRSTSCGT